MEKPITDCEKSETSCAEMLKESLFILLNRTKRLNERFHTENAEVAVEEQIRRNVETIGRGLDFFR